MRIDLTPFLILWVVSTTVVLVLILWRSLLTMHERVGLAEDELKDEADTVRKLARVDRWGKSMTIATAVLTVLIVSAWMYNALRFGPEIR
jgi:phosphatidylglycerophosphate synthase